MAASRRTVAVVCAVLALAPTSLSAAGAAEPTARPALRFQRPPPPQGLTIGTGTISGVYYAVGQALCDVLGPLTAEAGGCRPRITAGSVENIDSLRGRTDAFGLVQSDIQEAAVRGGSDLFKSAEPFAELRAVLSLHEEVVTVFARPDLAVTDVGGLKGRRLNVGTLRSGDEATADIVLRATGWTPADLARRSTRDPVLAAEALCRGDLDAVFAVIGHPSLLAFDLTARCGARLVGWSEAPMAQLISHHGAYTATAIPGGLYRHNADPVRTVAVRATLLTTADRDDDLVYELVRRVLQSQEVFRKRHPALASLEPREMARVGLLAPLHPGAARYFREAGLTD